MNVFSVKSLALYSLAIGSAIGFFQIVTSYGDTNIKAPISVVGNYLITADRLPNCLENKQLLLNLQQSGIYLNASLVNKGELTKMTREYHSTLSGRLNNRQFNLSGPLPATICAQLSQLQITGSLSETPSAKTNNIAKTSNPQQLQGKLAIDRRDGSPQSLFDFTGTFQPSTRSTQSH